MGKNTENLLNKVIEKPLNEFVQKITADFEGNITSICVTGSALTEDFVEGKSGINTVLVFEKESIELLDTLSGISKLLLKHKFDMPLIMTPRDMKRSEDVFGVEYLDLQLNHMVLWGTEPFDSLNISKSDVRLQCERELKANLIRLRQGYVVSKMGGGKIRDVLVCGARSLMPYLRAMLWLCDKPREAGLAATVDAAANELKFDGLYLKNIAGWKYNKVKPDTIELREHAAYLYNLTNELAIWVDQCKA